MKSKLIILLTLVPFSSFSTGNNFEINKTRVIYSDSTPSVQISNNKAYPLIIQSNIWDENNNKNHDFIATPPIFKMESESRNIIKIIKTNIKLPDSQESMRWLCIESMPPIEKSTKINRKEGRTDSINISIRGCIKLIYRPASVPSPVFNNIVEKLKWHKNGKYLVLKNNTPYYISFSEVFFDSDKVNNAKDILYVKPYSEKKIDISNRIIKKIKWAMIDDAGAKTKLYESIL